MTKPKAKSKKVEKPKEQSGGSNPLEQKNLSTNAVSPASSIQSTSASKPAPKAWFTTDIQHMMFAMGDCRRPLIESALLIEDITHQQMTSLLLKASEVTTMRGARFISLEDFLFLMRRDRDKLKRLLRFLSMKDLKSKLNKTAAVDDEDMYSETAGDVKPIVSKRRKISFEFLNTIDQTGELVALFEEEDQLDEIKQERLERAEKQSRNLDTTSYQEYTESRQVNFHKKASKFKEWLDCSHLVETKPNPLAMEVLSYLAYETVAQVVDLSLLVQKDMGGLVSDPFVQTIPPGCVSDANLYSPSTQGTPRIKASATADSPNHSPPSTPTTPTSSVVSPFLSSSSNLTTSFNSNSSNGSLQQSANSQSNLAQNPVTKPKPKKRKKSGATSALEDGTGTANGNAIQPLHIREAMRRYYQNIGPLAAFSKHSSVPFIMKFLGC